MNTQSSPYPPINDYALISDCHCISLISRAGSVDWCCMPRLDDDSLFGRLLDWKQGGHCALNPADGGYTTSRQYLPGTMVLETRFHTEQGEVRLLDFLAMDSDPSIHSRYEHVRIVEGLAGEVEMEIDICPRFDYGEIVPHVRQHESGAYTAIGSNKGLIIHAEVPLDVIDHHSLRARFTVTKGQRQRFQLRFEYPEFVDGTARHNPLTDFSTLDADLEHTCRWWRDWSNQIEVPFQLDPHTFRSALTLKALTFERTGAIVAAATTSLPETMGGERNWDYRFSWVRDSVFAVRALHLLGFSREADRFHQFIKRSAAGRGAELQIMYGVDGKRRLTEIELDWLDGYRQSRPVRVGNKAAKQMQLDIYGELFEMAWQSHTSKHFEEQHYWAFLTDVANTVCNIWTHTDHGIWEMRSAPVHYVHSKVMCWTALNRAIHLAEENDREAPVSHWKAQRDAIRHDVETKGYDQEKGVFVQAYGSQHMDASLLLLPRVGFVEYDDPRMLRTTDAICKELEFDGLLKRYKSPDSLEGSEGVFLPCTFWLVACLAYQGRHEAAWRFYEKALACSNDVALFSEEFDPVQQEMLGNFPQALTHVSQITARLALAGNDHEPKEGVDAG